MIDMKKQYKTRRGNKVQVLSTTLPGSKPVAAAIMYSDNDCGVYNFTSAGKFLSAYGENECDLIEVKPVREGWVNIYCHPSDPGRECWLSGWNVFPTREAALAAPASQQKQACIKIQFTEGEGL